MEVLKSSSAVLISNQYCFCVIVIAYLQGQQNCRPQCLCPHQSAKYKDRRRVSIYLPSKNPVIEPPLLTFKVTLLQQGRGNTDQRFQIQLEKERGPSHRGGPGRTCSEDDSAAPALTLFGATRQHVISMSVPYPRFYFISRNSDLTHFPQLLDTGSFGLKRARNIFVVSKR